MITQEQNEKVSMDHVAGNRPRHFRSCDRRTSYDDATRAEVIYMPNTRWRARREAYLRESGRTLDLIREGFVKNGLAVINGGGRRLQSRQCRLTLIIVNASLATGNTCPDTEGKA